MFSHPTMIPIKPVSELRFLTKSPIVIVESFIVWAPIGSNMLGRIITISTRIIKEVYYDPFRIFDKAQNYAAHSRSHISPFRHPASVRLPIGFKRYNITDLHLLSPHDAPESNLCARRSSVRLDGSYIDCCRAIWYLSSQQ